MTHRRLHRLTPNPGQAEPGQTGLVGHRSRGGQRLDPVDQSRDQLLFEHLTRVAVDRCCDDRSGVHIETNTPALVEHRKQLVCCCDSWGTSMSGRAHRSRKGGYPQLIVRESFDASINSRCLRVQRDLEGRG